LPHDEARSVDRPRILTTDVRRSDMYSGVCQATVLFQKNIKVEVRSSGAQPRCWQIGVPSILSLAPSPPLTGALPTKSS